VRRFFALILGLAAVGARAEVAVEVGSGINATNAQLVLAGLRLPASPLFGKQSYFELNAGGWDGPTGTALVGAARGVELGGERLRFAGSVGVSLISQTSEVLGSAFQFYEQVQLRYRFHRTDVGTFYRHWSNASVKQPNYGADFAGIVTSFRW
jgi:hypothetical protein